MYVDFHLSYTSVPRFHTDDAISLYYLMVSRTSPSGQLLQSTTARLYSLIRQVDTSHGNDPILDIVVGQRVLQLKRVPGFYIVG